MAEKALFVLGLALYFPGEGSFAFTTGAHRRTYLTHNQRSSTAQSAATSTVVRRPCLQYADSSQQLMAYLKHIVQASRTRRLTVLGAVPDDFVSASGAEGDGGKSQTTYDEGDMGMAPVDMEQAMGSFSPEWDNTTARADPRESVIKGSVIAVNQTAFPFSIDSFPPLSNSEVYYNGTSEKFWWNQNAEAVCVYVPVPVGFDQSNVAFVAKSRHVSLSLDGKEVLAGTPFYRISSYDSLFVVDSENDPPYVQLELYKLREYQNWEDLFLEGSSFTPGGAK